MLRPNNNKARDSKTLVRQILKLSADIFQAIKLRIPPEWLMSDMTVAQLRVLLFLYTDGQSRMSSIASSLGIAVSTATGVPLASVWTAGGFPRPHPDSNRAAPAAAIAAAISTRKLILIASPRLSRVAPSPGRGE